MFFIVLTAGIFGLVSSTFVPTPTEQYRNHVVLDPDRNYHLFWKFEESFIIFEVHVHTVGWVGFGLSSSGNMIGADLVVAWVGAGGKPFFYDTHASTPGRPQLDGQQNWWLTHARQEDGVTVIRFYRYLTSCDASGEDMNIVDSTQRLIYAYGSTNPSDLNSLPKHASNRRGTLSVRLLIPAHAQYSDPVDAWTHDIVNNQLSVPSDRTTYWCSFQRFPKPSSKQHLFKIAPLVTFGNERLVHHVILYACNSQTNASLVGSSSSCQAQNMPEHGCDVIIGAWAIGGGAFNFPDHVGLPVGSSYGPDIVMLEMHYDNPDQLTTYVDSSGLRLSVTPTLRREDAGVIMTGAFTSPSLIIPPYQADLRASAFCSEQCLRQTLDDASVDGIQVFSSLLHSHLLGRKLSARIIRDGREVANLGVDDFYDFNFQEFRELPREVKIKAGDSIITECSMDSTGRSTVTYGGIGTSEEMCLSFFYYYPRVSLTGCFSGHDSKSILRLFGATNVTWDSRTFQWRATAPANMKDLTAADLAQRQDWSDSNNQQQFLTHLQSATAPHDVYCTFTNNLIYYRDNQRFPQYTKASAPSTPQHCSRTTGSTTRACAGLFTVLVLLMASVLA